MVRGLVFDLDGVLVHTDELHYRAWKALAGRLGLPLHSGTGDRCRGVSRMGSLEILLEGSNRSHTEREKLRMAEEKNDCYRAQLQELTPGDVPERTGGDPEGAAPPGLSAGPGLQQHKNAGVILTRTGLDALLDRVVDGNQITRSKPDPEVFLRAARLLELPPEDCAGVDDALAGVESARTAGMTAAAIGPAALAGAGDWNLECLSRLLDLCPPLEGAGPVIRLIACDIDGTLLRGHSGRSALLYSGRWSVWGNRGSASARPAGGSTTACGGCSPP